MKVRTAPAKMPVPREPEQVMPGEAGVAAPDQRRQLIGGGHRVPAQEVE
jgi:hypothetical protein